MSQGFHGPASGEAMNVRVLPPAEYPRLDGTEAEELWPHLREDTSRVLVVEDGERIVGTWTLVLLPHAECVWIDPEYRGSPGVVRGLLSGMSELAQEAGISLLTCGPQSERVERFIERLGGRPVPGRAWFLPVDRKKGIAWADKPQSRRWKAPDLLPEVGREVRVLSSKPEEVGKWA